MHGERNSTQAVSRIQLNLRRSLLPVIFVIAACGGAKAKTDPAAKLPSRPVTSGYDLATHSLSFANFAGESRNSSLKPDSVARMFGQSAVCASVEDGHCRLTPLAQTWLERINQSMGGGRCEGFAVLSGLFFLDELSPSDFGASSPVDLDIIGNPVLGDEIAYWFSTQFLQNITKDQTQSLSAVELVDFLGTALGKQGTEREMFRLGIMRVKEDGRVAGGHAVLAYEVLPGAGGLFYIKVYDNNHPGEERVITVDPTANRWEYQASSNPDEASSLYVGDPANKNRVFVTPIRPRTGAQPCIFCNGTETDGELALSQLFTFGSVEAAARTETGATTGVVDGQFVNDVPGATLVPNFSEGAWEDLMMPTIFLPPANTTIVLNGKEGETPMSVTLFGKGFESGIDGPAVPVGVAESLTVTAGGTAISYLPASASRGVSLHTALQTNNGSQVRFEVAIPEGLEATSLELAVNPGTGNAAVQADMTGDTVLAVRVTKSDASAENVLDGEVSVPRNGGVAFDVENWQVDSNTIAVTVDVDGDGTFDQSDMVTGNNPVETLPPVEPTDLVATAVSQSSIELTWTDAATDETEYRVYRTTGSNVQEEIAVLAVNSTSYLDTNLLLSTTYDYRVLAANSYGTSSLTEVASATTLGCPAGQQDNNGDYACEPACDVNACGGRGTCSDAGGFAVCACNTGYAGAACGACASGYQDNDVNGTCTPTCATASLSCANSTTCSDSSGAARCACPENLGGLLCDRCALGFTGTNCTQPRRVSSGAGHACAVTGSGKVRCWGDNSSGALGVASQPRGDAAVALNLGAALAVQVSSGSNFNCATFADASARCWGNNTFGQASGLSGANVPVGSGDPVPPNLFPADQVRSVVTGNAFACALLGSPGTIRCWGENDQGQCGKPGSANPLTLASSTAIGAFDASGIAQICAGEKHACALTGNGAVHCWGEGGNGALGHGSTSNIGDNEEVLSAGPVPVLSSADVTAGRFVQAISCGGKQTCAILDNGGLRCWGGGTEGVLGYGNTTTIGDDEVASSVGLVNTEGTVTQVTLGGATACALLSTGQVKCWGTAANGGCLGHGGSCASPITSPPLTVNGVILINSVLGASELGTHAAGSTLCAMESSNNVKCWNNNAGNACGLNVGTNPIDPLAAQYSLSTNNTVAVRVLGQADFSSSGFSTSSSTMNQPQGLSVDPTTGAVFVADRDNHRVLRFASYASLTNGSAAVGVLGQANFTDNTLSPAASDKMRQPMGVYVDTLGTLWVSDTNNNRVLRFDNATAKANGASADAVLGQTSYTGSGFGTSPTEFYSPHGIFLDIAGNLFVSDYTNSRVLRFDAAATKNADGTAGVPADAVLGQADFTSGASGLASNRMAVPRQIIGDSAGRLWVADTVNNRVLRFDNAASKANGAPADGVLGQADLVSGTSGSGLNQMSNPSGITVAPNGWLYVADGVNNRILAFDAAGSLIDGAPATMAISQTPGLTLGYGWALAYHPATNILWCSDTARHRVLGFEPN